MTTNYENMENWDKDNVLDFIRKTLTIDANDIELIKLGINDGPIRLRFEMSGYETSVGNVTILNQSILNRFADLGIYDFTKYLFLDFYKGTPTLYLQYFMEDENEEYTFSGYSTSEIIYEIFKLTIFSNKCSRRRI